MSAAPETPKQKPVVLVVDDEVSLAHMAAMSLSDEGYTAVAATSLGAASVAMQGLHDYLEASRVRATEPSATERPLIPEDIAISIARSLGTLAKDGRLAPGQRELLTDSHGATLSQRIVMILDHHMPLVGPADNYPDAPAPYVVQREYERIFGAGTAAANVAIVGASGKIWDIPVVDPGIKVANGDGVTVVKPFNLTEFLNAVEAAAEILPAL